MKEFTDLEHFCSYSGVDKKELFNILLKLLDNDLNKVKELMKKGS